MTVFVCQKENADMIFVKYFSIFPKFSEFTITIYIGINAQNPKMWVALGQFWSIITYDIELMLELKKHVLVCLVAM